MKSGACSVGESLASSGFVAHTPLVSDPVDSPALLTLVYDELRSLARSRLGHVPPGNTLQATALVHEAYLRISGRRDDITWNSRGHFFAAAAEAMRQILVEQARRKSRIKHGGELARVDLDPSEIQLDAQIRPEDIVAVDDALRRLETVDTELAMIVKLRFFAGLGPDEIASLMDISRRTVERRWRYAAALLRQCLSMNEGALDDDPA